MKIKKILTEIKELNSIDNKTITERSLKFNEEYGEFCAEVCKFVGITYKPYDRDHLIEEMADAQQNLFSIYLDICDKTGITMEEVFDTILVKNKKWREKAPLYTKNTDEIQVTPEIRMKVKTSTIEGGVLMPLTVRNCFYHGFWGKTRVILLWLFSFEGKTFNEYLDSKVTYVMGLDNNINAFYHADAEKELEKILREEI
jgi:hypothetical protein